MKIIKEQYLHREYNTPRRWMSYWYQIQEILDRKPHKLLEIGKGNGIVTNYIDRVGIEVTTCDIEKKIRPDVVADIRNLPFKNSSFDFVLCAQVLEHIPFKDFQTGLKNIYKVTKKWALVTLPDYSVFDFYLGFKIFPFIPKFVKTFKIRLPVSHRFNGDHYWEISKRGYPLNKIRSTIKETGFEIIKDYCPNENPFHHFFLLKK